MAESTLSITYDLLAVEIAVFLCYSATDTDWTAAQVAEIDRYIQAGLRQFYYPPMADGVSAGYEWSFLKPVTTIDTIPRYTTGSIAVVAGTCTITTGVWPAWAATHGTLVIDSVVYSITTRDGDAELTVVGDDVTAANTEWYLSHAAYQDLPDDLGRVTGDFYFESTEYKKSVVQVSESQVLTALSRTSDVAPPRMCTIRQKAQVPPAGQRLEVVWFPIPDAVYTLTYNYEAYTGQLTTAGNPYPLGGMKYSELVTESCLAIAEQKANDEQGLHTAAFFRLLVAGIAMDRKQGARYYGQMSPVPDDTPPRHHLAGVNYPVTYDGVTW